MSTSNADALLALADVASVYEQCNSIAGLLQQPSVQQQQPSAPALSHDTSAASAIQPAPAAPSRPAKKRPVPAELQLSPVAPASEASTPKKSKTAPQTIDYPIPTADMMSLPPLEASLPSKRPKSKNKTKQRSSSLTHTPSFPAILMGMLSTPQNSEYISFLPDGKRFVILDAAGLESKLLPLHFLPVHFEKKEAKLSKSDTANRNLYWDFTRMLEEWEFESDSNCEEYPGKDVYSHPMFKEGDWEGCLKMSKPGNHSALEGMCEGNMNSSLLEPISMPSLPTEEMKQIADPSHSLAYLNASLSKHMSATETSRILCNRYGLLDSSRLHGLMAAHQQQNSGPVISQESALHALMMQVSQQPQDALLQAMSQDSSSLETMMASHANLQALMSAQQARSRLLSAAVETFQGPNCSKPRTISPEFSQAAASLLGNQANLDVMMERFIKQSIERMMGRQAMRSQMGQHQQGFDV